MIIDQTRYSCFLRNPEYFRLKYVKNLAVPRASAGYGLQRGTAFHVLAEMEHAGATAAEIDTALQAQVPDEKARKQGKIMHEAHKRANFMSGKVSKLAAEVEFCFAIPGSPHKMAGRIDAILDYKGATWCGETKTANGRVTYDQLVHDWRYNPQADFEIIGARMSGYNAVGVLVQTVKEGTPPIVLPDIEVVRHVDALNVLCLNVHQVCETITMYRNTFGDDEPWPHFAGCYPCNSAKDACEFKDICGKPTRVLSPVVLAKFVPREEHLNVIAAATGTTK